MSVVALVFAGLSTDSRLVDTPAGASSLGGVIDVASGAQHSCGVLLDATVRCWGSNRRGQLGSGSRAAMSTIPVAVVGLRGVVGLSASWDHTCAVDRAGAVWCWGANTDGQLGDGTTVDRNVPVRVAGPSGAALGVARSVDAGWGHTCAVRSDATVRCWGNNTSGELGDGTTTDRLQPVGVVGLTGAHEVSAGGRHSCARVADATVRCWGSNATGAIGGSAGAVPAARIVTGVTRVARISAGGEHTCVSLADGTARCWGGGSSGQLGGGTRVDVAGVIRPAVAGVVALSSGWANTCAVTSAGALWCWGFNTQRQVGDASSLPRLIPTAVKGGAGFSHISVGGGHSCARAVSGAARCWGDNDQGALGTGSTSAAALPTNVQGIPLTAPQDYVPVTPARLLDTRPGARTVDRRFELGRIRRTGELTRFTATGRGGISPTVGAIVVNVTAVGSTAGGFLTVWRCGDHQPPTSTLNFTAGATVPNLAIVGLNGSNDVCIVSSSPTHVVIDVSGYIPLGGPYRSLAPIRVMDTRRTGTTVDRRFQRIGVRTAGTTTALAVVGRRGGPTEASAVVLTLTAVQSARSGSVTAWPCGTPKPVATVLSFAAARTRAATAVLAVGADGAVCLSTTADVELVADLSGSFGRVSPFQALRPGRVYDSRPNGATVDGVGARGGRLAANSTTAIPLVARHGMPGNVRAVELTITAVGPGAVGYLTVFPCGAVRPNAANLNVAPGSTSTATALAGVALDGRTCIFSTVATDLLVDVLGYVA